MLEGGCIGHVVSIDTCQGREQRVEWRVPMMMRSLYEERRIVCDKQLFDDLAVVLWLGWIGATDADTYLLVLRIRLVLARAPAYGTYVFYGHTCAC